MIIDVETGYSVFKEKCYCCKTENNCKIIDKKLVCQKCNHIEK